MDATEKEANLNKTAHSKESPCYFNNLHKSNEMRKSTSTLNTLRKCPKINTRAVNNCNNSNVHPFSSEKQSALIRNRKMSFNQSRPFYHCKKPMARISDKPGPKITPRLLRPPLSRLSHPIQRKMLKPINSPNSSLLLPKTNNTARSTSKSTANAFSTRSSATNISNLTNNRLRNNNSSLSNMINSKMTQVKNMQSKIEELNRSVLDLKNENRLLKRQNSRQEKALDRVIKNESRQAEIPSLASRHADEVRNLRDQIRKSREKYLVEIKRNKTIHSDNMKLKDKLIKLENMSSQKKWKDQEIMKTKLQHLETVVAEKEVKIMELRKHINNLQKNHWHEITAEISKHKETQNQVQELFQRVKDLEKALLEKDKCMGNNNIYRNRSSKNTTSYSSKVSDYSSDSCDEMTSLNQRGDDLESKSKGDKSPFDNASESIEASTKSPTTATQPLQSEMVDVTSTISSKEASNEGLFKNTVQSASKLLSSQRIRQQRAHLLKQEKLRKETENICPARGDFLEIQQDKQQATEVNPNHGSSSYLYVTPCVNISSFGGHFSDLLENENLEYYDSKHVDFTAPSPDVGDQFCKGITENKNLNANNHSLVRAKDKELKSILKPVVSKRQFLKREERGMGERNSFESLATEILGVDIKKENELIQELFESNYTPSIHSISQMCDKNDSEFQNFKSRLDKEIIKPNTSSSKVTFKSNVLPNIAQKLNYECNDEET